MTLLSFQFYYIFCTFKVSSFQVEFTPASLGLYSFSIAFLIIHLTSLVIRLYSSWCFLKSSAGRAFVRPSTSIAELSIHSIANSPSSTNPHKWWCMTPMCFVWFWLSRSFVKVRLVSLSSSIFISLTASSGSSLFQNHWIYIPSLAPLLMATYSASKVDVKIVRYLLLHQVTIALAKKKQYPVIDFLPFRLPT